MNKTSSDLSAVVAGPLLIHFIDTFVIRRTKIFSEQRLKLSLADCSRSGYL